MEINRHLENGTNLNPEDIWKGKINKVYFGGGETGSMYVQS